MKSGNKHFRRDRKAYCVCVEIENPNGGTVLRPIRDDGTIGAFPDGSTTRYRAKKHLARAVSLQAGAHLVRQTFL